MAQCCIQLLILRLLLISQVTLGVDENRDYRGGRPVSDGRGRRGGKPAELGSGRGRHYRWGRWGHHHHHPGAGGVRHAGPAAAGCSSRRRRCRIDPAVVVALSRLLRRSRTPGQVSRRSVSCYVILLLIPDTLDFNS